MQRHVQKCAPAQSAADPARSPSNAQLHGTACVVCGRTDGELLPRGHVAVEVRPGESLAGAVVACPEHQGGLS